MSKLVMKNNINSELSITHADNKPAKSIIGTDIAVAVDTINDFPLDANDGDTVIVRDLDRGGTFIYDSTKVAGHNDGTNFNGWIRQYSGAVNVKWFGAIGDGITDDTLALQKAFLLKDVTADKGKIFLVSNSLEITSDFNLDFKNSTIKITSSSVSCLYSESAFNTQINNLIIDGNNQASSIGMQMSNFRHFSEINNVKILNATVGYNAKELCWDTQYYGVKATGCTTGFIIEEGSNGSVFNQCSADGCSVGFIIQDGLTYPTVNVKIIGGFAQNCSEYGVKDSARATRIDSMYFENCATSDILLDSAIFPTLENTYHSGTSGAVCVKGANSEGASIKNIVYDGNRTNGIFDFDSSNTYAYAEYQRTATLSTALGNTDGIKIFNNLSGTNTAGNIGVDNGIIKAITGSSPAKYVTRSLTNGFNIEYNLFSTEYNANLGQNIVHKTCGGATALTTKNMVAGQEVTFIIKASNGYTSGDISIDGITLNMTGVGANKYTYVKVYKSGLYAKTVITDNVWV